ncbi:MAG: methyltransferase domain-containing protein [Sphingomonas sp.]|nr:methyltransferase domain-containing protein [Sphingomonas sp.]MBW0007401.1 methyltransferase domain-containing protein [Sphingomonas sp.]
MADAQELTNSYNDELFSGSALRRFYHLARFNWVRDKADKHLDGDLRLIELGCYDGRLFDTLGPRVVEYAGLDANWSGGLDLARAKYGSRKDVTLIEATDPDGFRRFSDRQFNVAAALETLEHVPPDLVAPYLDQLQRVTRGNLFVTVPNELGPVFLAKHLGKKILYGGEQAYSPSEVLAAALRQSHKVKRDDHKGFDYRDVVAEIGKRFEILAVEGLASFGLPAALSPTVGIFARSR